MSESRLRRGVIPGSRTFTGGTRVSQIEGVVLVDGTEEAALNLSPKRPLQVARQVASPRKRRGWRVSSLTVAGWLK